MIQRNDDGPECPFCGCDPYEYVENGIGVEPVDVTCCELGVIYWRGTTEDTVQISRGQFEAIADLFRAMRTLGMNPQLPE